MNRDLMNFILALGVALGEIPPPIALTSEMEAKLIAEGLAYKCGDCNNLHLTDKGKANMDAIERIVTERSINVEAWGLS